ncbi:MAG: DNA-3-methyladenine glycosylase 2 family protein [Ruminococcus sp.]|nr:DNA-3-methyladenine glycosylase 2 family protein [Ruminococcus sp.]
MSKLVFENVSEFDLRQTLDCGQCFRFTENEDGTFCGVVRGVFATVSYENEVLTIESDMALDEKMWRDYFDLDLDYSKIKNDLSKMHPVLKEASSYAGGIRILNQEPFEALITFIISQNNNIGRIKGIVQRLCENFGEKIDETHYAFPTACKLSSLSCDDLAVIRAGFRHRYIIDAAQKVHSGEIDLQKLRTSEYYDAQKELMKITGVGVKVADCALLYGLHRLESFPLDVWMKRALSVLFKGYKGDEFGLYGGIAQQYIFHYSRMHKELFD